MALTAMHPGEHLAEFELRPEKIGGSQRSSPCMTTFNPTALAIINFTRRVRTRKEETKNEHLASVGLREKIECKGLADDVLTLLMIPRMGIRNAPNPIGEALYGRTRQAVLRLFFGQTGSPISAKRGHSTYRIGIWNRATSVGASFGVQRKHSSRSPYTQVDAGKLSPLPDGFGGRGKSGKGVEAHRLDVCGRTPWDFNEPS